MGLFYLRRVSTDGSNRANLTALLRGVYPLNSI